MKGEWKLRKLKFLLLSLKETSSSNDEIFKAACLVSIHNQWSQTIISKNTETNQS